MKKFKPNRPVSVLVGIEDSCVCIFGIYSEAEEAEEDRKNIVSERSALIRKTMETTSKITKKQLNEKHFEASDSVVNQSYQIIKLNLNSPDKQIIWRLE